MTPRIWLWDRSDPTEGSTRELANKGRLPFKSDKEGAPGNKRGRNVFRDEGESADAAGLL